MSTYTVTVGYATRKGRKTFTVAAADQYEAAKIGHQQFNGGESGVRITVTEKDSTA